MPNAIENLRKARKLLKGHWTQGSFKTCDDEFCLTGAISWIVTNGYSASQADDFAPEELELICRAINTPVSVDPYTNEKEVYSWNDTEGRTEKEVLAAIDSAIAIAKEMRNG